MAYYDELKQLNDILLVANLLGFRGAKTGSAYQGDCPQHASSSGRCLVIWPGIQGYKCFHCGEAGDVIDLVMLYKRCDHRAAVQYLADRVGMPHPSGGKDQSPEERAQREADAKEESLVYGMLTEAAEWYHRQLLNFPDIADHLRDH